MATLTSREDERSALERSLTALAITNMRLRAENTNLHTALDHVANIIVDLANVEKMLDDEDHEMQDLASLFGDIESHIHEARLHNTYIMEAVLTAAAERLQGAISDLCFELAQVP